MRKSIFQAIYTVLMGLFIYSCSGLTLPEQIGVKGTLNLPIRVGAADLNKTLANKFTEAFSAGEQQGARVYNVDYPGQKVQTFCIYLPIEMTEDLNPSSLLKAIEQQIKQYPLKDPLPGNMGWLGTNEYQDLSIEIPLGNIPGYVECIKFDEYNGDPDDKGIGIYFEFSEIVEGLEIDLNCAELNIDHVIKPLKKNERIIFGNKDDLTLNPGAVNKLMLDLRLRQKQGSSYIPPPGEIKGEMHFFHNWIEASIDLKEAIKALPAGSNTFNGNFPDTPLNLSGLNKYLEGEFAFDDLDVKLYMNGINTGFINNELNPAPALSLEAQYGGDKYELYKGDLILKDSKLIKLDDYLNKNESYKYKQLPNIPGYDIKKGVIKDIFKTRPAELSFAYKIELDGKLIVCPDTFASGAGNSGENSKITAMMMIMLPMNLTAEGAGDQNSSIFLPNMFGEKDDLFGREEPKELFSKGKIDYIKMTIDFSNSVFTEGRLFINEKKELFPDGVRLDGKNIELNFTKEQLDIIEERLIVPDIKIEIDKGGMISVPKDMAIMSIRLEMKGLINIGEH